MRCEGYRRPGVMALGPNKWVQCEETAISSVVAIQDGDETDPTPLCSECVSEAENSTSVKILSRTPISEPN